MDSSKIKELETFIKQEVALFSKMLQDATVDIYTANPVLRRAIDKSLNDIILACVDLAAILLRLKKHAIPKSYREIILTTFEFAGDAALRVAPLVSCRNETIHSYLKINWENVKTVKNAREDILRYVEKVVALSGESL